MWRSTAKYTRMHLIKLWCRILARSLQNCYRLNKRNVRVLPREYIDAYNYRFKVDLLRLGCWFNEVLRESALLADVIHWNSAGPPGWFLHVGSECRHIGFRWCDPRSEIKWPIEFDELSWSKGGKDYAEIVLQVNCNIINNEGLGSSTCWRNSEEASLTNKVLTSRSVWRCLSFSISSLWWFTSYFGCPWQPSSPPTSGRLG
jgi:hypothetical protein